MCKSLWNALIQPENALEILGGSSFKMQKKRGQLRTGFSTGTAVAAAARAAIRLLVSGRLPQVVAVRLPAGWYYPVPIFDGKLAGNKATVSVIKDGGDDPDVTHNAELQTVVRPCLVTDRSSGICLVAGPGIGAVTKVGLPISVGEPAINPIPRQMLSQNIAEELKQGGCTLTIDNCSLPNFVAPKRPHVFLEFDNGERTLRGLVVEVEVRAPKGIELARFTLNGRLGIHGGISILGTTGIVRPFSHESYKETIQTALSVAKANGCDTIVLTTGGKSERLTRALLPALPAEAFVQIADFFGFAIEEAARMGFEKLIVSVFFGKALKMSQGHYYTHAHTVPLDLKPLASVARSKGYPESFCEALEYANTAREALEIITSRGAHDTLGSITDHVLKQIIAHSGLGVHARVLLFDYEGNLLHDREI